MSYTNYDLINAIANKNPLESDKILQDLILARINDKVEARKEEIRSSIINPIKDEESYEETTEDDS